MSQGKFNLIIVATSISTAVAALVGAVVSVVKLWYP